MNKYLSFFEEEALKHLEKVDPSTQLPFHEWIKLLRKYLRMTQAELAKRSQLSQSHIVKIEMGQPNIQINTLRKVFEALSCNLVIQPQPFKSKSLETVRRNRARIVALKRLKQTMGTMALEGQSPESETFKKILEKKTDEILNDPREKLWNKKNDG